MSLWKRFKTWWDAGKAGRQMINARRQHDRAAASVAGAATLIHGPDMSGYHGMGGYHAPSGADCSPGVNGNCSPPAL
jgi:hypothetical protein